MISYDVRSSCIPTSWMVWSWVTYLHFLLHSHTPKSIFVHVWWIYILHTSIKFNSQSAQIINTDSYFMWSTTPFSSLSPRGEYCVEERSFITWAKGRFPVSKVLSFWVHQPQFPGGNCPSASAGSLQMLPWYPLEIYSCGKSEPIGSLSTNGPLSICSFYPEDT